jgi:hypothetical protein
MARQHVFVSSSAPSPLRHLPLTAQIQTQAMSHAKFVFLIALVIFFVVLFVAAYLWMRRPDFGQKGGRPISTTSESTVARAAHHAPNQQRTDGEVVPTDPSRTSEGR